MKTKRMFLREMAGLLKTSTNREMLFAAVMRLYGALSLETLLTLKAEASLIFLLGKWRQLLFIIERHLFLFLKILPRNEASKYRSLE
jgi:hypothetical protein